MRWNSSNIPHGSDLLAFLGFMLVKMGELFIEFVPPGNLILWDIFFEFLFSHTPHQFFGEPCHLFLVRIPLILLPQFRRLVVLANLPNAFERDDFVDCGQFRY